MLAQELSWQILYLKGTQEVEEGVTEKVGANRFSKKVLDDLEAFKLML